MIVHTTWPICLLVVHMIVLQVSGSVHFTRKITATLNPGCPDTLCNTQAAAETGDQPQLITVVHVRAAGQTDDIHHVWDFTGKPSVLVARTVPHANLTINWRLFMDNVPNSVRFDVVPMYTTCLVLDRIIQYNDADDIGYLLDSVKATTNSSSAPPSTAQQPLISYSTQNITWQRDSFVRTDRHAAVEVTGTNVGWFGAGAAVRLKFKAFGRRQYDLQSPHMLHSENGTQIDVMLERLNASALAARFAIELVHIAGESSTDNDADAAAAGRRFLVQKRRSLDDEHTPGVFELVDVVSPAALAHANGSYLHYRPVSYRSAERDMGGSTDVHVSEPLAVADADAQRLTGSMAWTYYGYEAYEALVLMQSYNVSFGRSGDGFYAKSLMNTWTFEMGYGTPPEERMSLFVVIVASVGLVLPVVLLLSGGLYICAKRLRARRRRRHDEQDFY